MSKMFQNFIGKVMTSFKGKPSSLSRVHRKFNDEDLKFLRRVDGTKFENCLNPGLRVQPNYIDEKYAADLLECALQLKIDFGFKSCEAQDVLVVTGDTNAPLDIKIDPMRVTGRPELPNQKYPWGYGDDFKIDMVPPVLRNLALRIESDANFGQLRKGSLRDITINYRDHSMFKLDPHCDPASDGENVFIIGLLSDVVLTFTPPDSIEGSRLSVAAGVYRGNETMRTHPGAICAHSWTDFDIDVDLKKHYLVHFTGPAKTLWRHAIRTGVDVGPPYNGICDWFGDLNHLARRNPERISIVFAFE